MSDLNLEHCYTSFQMKKWIQLITNCYGIPKVDPDTAEKSKWLVSAFRNFDINISLAEACKLRDIHSDCDHGVGFPDLFPDPMDTVDFMIGKIKEGNLVGAETICFNLAVYDPPEEEFELEWSKFLNIELHMSLNEATVTPNPAWNNLDQTDKATIITNLLTQIGTVQEIGPWSMTPAPSSNIQFVDLKSSYQFEAFFDIRSLDSVQILPLWGLIKSPITQYELMEDVRKGLLEFTSDFDEEIRSWMREQ